MRKYIAVLLIMVIGVGLYVTTKDDPITSTPTMGNISIGISREIISSLPYIADTEGLFKKHGLNVLVKYYPSGKRALKNGLFNNEIDFTATSEVPVVFSSMERDDFAIVATIAVANNDPSIIARRDRGINDIEDLAGKHIATQKASAVHFFLHKFLTEHDIKDNKFSYMKAEFLPRSLSDGEIDAFSMREPFISRAKNLIGDNAIIFSEPGLYAKMNNVVAYKQFIKNNQAIVPAFVKALVDAEKFIKKNPVIAKEKIRTGLLYNNQRAIEKWEDNNLQVTLDRALLDGMNREAQWVFDNQFIETDIKPDYLDFIYFDALKKIKPSAVTIKH